MLPYEKSLKPKARRLRTQMTDAERKLWQGLRDDQLGARFTRQKPIARFIVDFYCATAKLVVELDGSQHAEPEHARKDAQRDRILAGMGLRVLRFDDRQALLETAAVLESIRLAVEQGLKRG